MRRKWPNEYLKNKGEAVGQRKKIKGWIEKGKVQPGRGRDVGERVNVEWDERMWGVQHQRSSAHPSFVISFAVAVGQGVYSFYIREGDEDCIKGSYKRLKTSRHRVQSSCCNPACKVWVRNIYTNCRNVLLLYIWCMVSELSLLFRHEC